MYKRQALVGGSRYAVKVAPDEYGVVVAGFLVDVAAVKEKARHIFINAAGGGEVVPRCAVVVVPGRQSEIRRGAGRAGLLRLASALFPGQHLDGFGEAPAVKLHDEINGVPAPALAVAVPLVFPERKAVVPLPAVFLPGAGKLFALRLQERYKVGLVCPVYLVLGEIHSRLLYSPSGLGR